MYLAPIKKILKCPENISAWDVLVDNYECFLWDDKTPLDLQWNNIPKAKKLGKLNLHLIDDNSVEIRFNKQSIITRLLLSKQDYLHQIFALNNLINQTVEIYLCIDSIGSSNLGFAFGRKIDWEKFKVEFGEKAFIVRFMAIPADFNDFLESISEYEQRPDISFSQDYVNLTRHLPIYWKATGKNSWVNVEQDDGGLDQGKIVNLINAYIGTDNSSINYLLCFNDQEIVKVSGCPSIAEKLFLKVKESIEVKSSYKGFITSFNFTELFIYDSDFETVLIIVTTSKALLWRSGELLPIS